jgi:hypothetical protein
LIDGGEGFTVLEYLMQDDQEHQELSDNVCLDVMKILKEIGLMVKEDIVRYELLMLLCQNYSYLAENKDFDF